MTTANQKSHEAPPAGGLSARGARLYDGIVLLLSVLALLAGVVLTALMLLSERT